MAASNMRLHRTPPTPAMHTAPHTRITPHTSKQRAAAGHTHRRDAREATARKDTARAGGVGRRRGAAAAARSVGGGGVGGGAVAGAKPGWVGEALGDEGAEGQDDDDGGLGEGAGLEAVPLDEFEGGEDDCEGEGGG
jgi:hypothetical protein